MSGEFLRDLDAFWEASGEPCFAKEYIRFGQLLSFDLDPEAKGRATDLNTPIIGRFRGLIPVETMARERPDLFKSLSVEERERLLEAAPLAANIVLHTWEDYAYGIIDPPVGRRTDRAILDAQDVYWLLQFVAEMPFSYPANRFLVEEGRLEEWRRAGAEKVWDGKELSVTGYLTLLSTNAEKSIEYLAADGKGYSFAEVRMEDGKMLVKRLPRQENEITMYDHTGLIEGVASAIHTIESVLSTDEQGSLGTYRERLEREQGARSGEFEAELRSRDERMLGQEMLLLKTYQHALPQGSWIPRESIGADGRGEGREDISSAQRAAVSATLLLDVADSLKMRPEEKTRLECIRRNTLRALLNEQHYLHRPGLQKNLLPFGLFGYGRFITGNAYGSFSGTIADVYKSLKSKQRPRATEEERRKKEQSPRI